MKSDRNNSTATLSAGVETRALRIDANAKAFKELISGIYQDKAYAIARETIANAVDSHVAAGTPERAFQLHVPTSWEPEYWIRDFGVSMDHDTVMGLYSTLFQSTKDDPDSDESNNFVGKFGLGSKSPFAYTDAFQVTAYLDGEQRIYDVFFDKGLPQIALLMRGDTDEENGILISFAVDPKDCNDFARAVRRAVGGLDFLPEFIGLEIEVDEREILSSGTGWTLYKRTHSGGAEAKQGTVLYPLNYNAIIDCPSELRTICNSPIQIDFEIGDLDVVTSREALSYDAETSDNIIKRLTEIRSEVEAFRKEETAEAKTYWDFNVAYISAQEKYPHNVFGTLDDLSISFKGKRPKRHISVNLKNKKTHVPSTDTTSADTLVEERFGSLEFCMFSKYKVNNTNLAFRPDRTVTSISIDLSEDIIVVTEDISQKKRYPSARIKKLVENLPWNSSSSGGRLLWIRHSGDEKLAMRRLFAAFGRPSKLTVINLLDIKYNPPTRDYVRPRRAAFKILSNGDFVTPAEGQETPKHALTIPMRHGDVDHPTYTRANFELLQEFLKDTGVVEDIPILGIPASSKRILTTNPQWINFGDFLDEHLADLFDADAYSRAYLRSQSLFRNTFWDTVVDIFDETQNAKEVFKGTSLEDLMSIEHRLSPVDDDGDGEKGDSIHTIIHKILLRKENLNKEIALEEHTDRDMALTILTDDEALPPLKFDTPYADLREAQDDLTKDVGGEIERVSQESQQSFPLLNLLNSYTSKTSNEYAELLNYISMKAAQMLAGNVDKAAAA